MSVNRLHWLYRVPAQIGTTVVNVTIVVDNGAHTGALPGRALRSQ